MHSLCAYTCSVCGCHIKYTTPFPYYKLSAALIAALPATLYKYTTIKHYLKVKIAIPVVVLKTLFWWHRVAFEVVHIAIFFDTWHKRRQ